LQTDPYELNNLLRGEGSAQLKLDLNRRLEELLDQAGASSDMGTGEAD
jgi:hypothetical protein